MTALVVVTGIARSTRELSARASGEVFGTEVSLMTEAGTDLGETLKVLVFDRDAVHVPTGGAKVSWVVEVEAGRYGLGATFRRLASAADVPPVRSAEPVGVQGK